MRNVLVVIGLVADCKTGPHAGEPTPAPPVAARDAPGPADAGSTAAIALPGGEHGIGFDDMRFATSIGKVVVPAGGTGNLVLIDPRTRALTTIGGFGTAEATGGHESGTTSADEGDDRLFAIDRTKLRLAVIDPTSNAITSSAPLASSPDYVRWVDATRELWVTEPDEDRIEVFDLAGATPTHAAFIPVRGGPESLVIAGPRAYTHLWKGATVVLDVASRKQLAHWPNGCEGSRGIALDAQHGWLFVGCAEGKAIVLDATDGKQLGSLAVGAGVDVIAYSEQLAHLYVPSAKTATLSIIGVGTDGTLRLLGTHPTARGAHCVTAAPDATAWVCDVRGGRVIEIADPYPATR
jgi:DNA-binding beta-propeller fold protein YncE